MIASILQDEKSINKGNEAWQAKQTLIKQAEEIANLVVVREDYYQHNGSNIYALDLSLNYVWTAELPNESDIFVNFVYTNSQLQCQTWNGFVCNIDIISGKILDKIFKK